MQLPSGSGQAMRNHLNRALTERYRGRVMNQGSRIFDELGRLMNDAAGIADGVRREIETVVKAQVQRFIGDMDLVKR